MKEKEGTGRKGHPMMPNIDNDSVLAITMKLYFEIF